MPLRSFCFISYPGDPNYGWESVERRLSNMEGMLHELHENAKDRAVGRRALNLSPADLGARLSDPCAKHSMHAMGTCGGRKHCG